MKIVSWNVNGLRAVHRNGYWPEFMSLKPDIICLQETKMEKEQMPDSEREIPGYKSLWNSSKKRKGYSGTAMYIAEPIAEKITEVIYGLGDKRFEGEGRVITVIFEDFALSNIYFPNGGMGPDRLSFKLGFYDAFLSFIENVRYNKQQNVLFVGDVNTAHNEIDLARPDANMNNTGFLPEERAWIDEVISSGFIDTFRYLHPNKVAYTWWDMKTRARERNVGWRFDYAFLSEEAIYALKDAKIHGNIYGSDHCPISVDLEF